MGGFDSPLSVPSFINAGDVAYLNSFTKKDKLRIKKEVLKTKQTDIRAKAEIFKKLYATSSEYTIGDETKIKEYSFENVKSL